MKTERERRSREGRERERKVVKDAEIKENEIG